MSTEYRDRWIECTDEAVRIRGYYFPWGTKRIPYRGIRGVRRVPMGALTGRIRIWGSANPRYWAGLDPARPAKREALILDVGRGVRPYLTPDDPDAVVAAIERHAAVAPTHGCGPVV